jgi:tRNA (guanosine-2'-O-)-methyltransferase
MIVRPRYEHFRELDETTLERAIAVLEPFVSAERQKRIDDVLATKTRDVVLVLEDIYDEHNASAVLRTAESFGVLEVHAVERTCRFVVDAQTSMGSHKWIELFKHRTTDMPYQALAARGYAIYASSIRGDAVNIEDVPIDRPLALVFGNEHEGLTPEAQAAADGRFRVPMHGFVESLNVSVATAISMYDVLARKRKSGRPIALDPLDRRRLRAAWFARSVRAAKPILERAGIVLG